MKKLVVIMSLLATNFAHADVLQSKIVSMDIEPGTFGQMKYTGGNVSVDEVAKTATLTLNPVQPECKPGNYCADFLYGPTTIVLPLISTDIDACGSVIYHAEKDLRTTDGDLQTLDINDNSKNLCAKILEISPIEVTYTVGNYTSYFQGDLFKRSI